QRGRLVAQRVRRSLTRLLSLRRLKVRHAARREGESCEASTATECGITKELPRNAGKHAAWPVEKSIARKGFVVVMDFHAIHPTSGQPGLADFHSNATQVRSPKTRFGGPAPRVGHGHHGARSYAGLFLQRPVV